MEDSVFLEEAVASLMKKELVEARLHTDSQKHLTKEQFARNNELRDELAGVDTAPYFVMVDPKTGEKIGEFALSGGWGSWPSKWTQWVEKMAAKAQG